MFSLLAICFVLFLEVSKCTNIKPGVHNASSKDLKQRNQDTIGKINIPPAINITVIRNKLLNVLKTQTLAKLNVDRAPSGNVGSPPQTGVHIKPGKLVTSTTIGFKEKAGELYIKMLRYLNIQMLDHITNEKTFQNKVSPPSFDLDKTATIPSSQTTSSDKTVEVDLYEAMANALNKEILHWEILEGLPVKHCVLKVKGVKTTRPPINLVNLEARMFDNVFNALKESIFGVFSFQSQRYGSFILGMNEYEDFTDLDLAVDEETKNIFAKGLKQLESSLNILMYNASTSKPPVASILLDFGDTGGKLNIFSLVYFVKITDELLKIIQKEVKTQVLVDMAFQEALDEPGTPHSLGSELALNETSETLKEAINQFGSIYMRILENTLRENFTLKDFNVSFKDPSATEESFFGHITFRKGTLILNTTLKIVDEPTSVVAGKIYVPINYKFTIQQEVLQYEYLVRITAEMLKGSFQATVSNGQMDAILVAKRKEGGKCSYESLGLHIRNPNVKKYSMLFNISGGTESTYVTERIKEIINTFILKNIIDSGSKPIVFDSLEKVNQKVIEKAKYEYRIKTKKELCDYIS